MQNENYCATKLNSLMEKCGMNNKYQIISLMIIFSLYGTAEFIAIALPLMEMNPYVTYFDSDLNKNVTTQVNYEICGNQLKKYSYFIEYEKSPSSLVTDFDIFCSENKTGFIGSSLFLGVMLGSFLSYFFSDKLGRKKTCIIFSFIYSINMIFLVLLTNIYLFYFFLFTTGLVYSIIILSSILLLNEVINVNLTAIFTTIIFNAYPVFGVFYCILFRDMNNWRAIFVIIGIIHFISTVFLYFLVEESPRFFFAQKDMENLQKCLIKIATVNKIKVKNLEDNFISLLKKDDEENFINKIDNVTEEESDKIPLKEIRQENNEKELTIELNKNKDYKEISNRKKISSISLEENSQIKNQKKEKNINDYTIYDILRYKSQRTNFLVICLMWVVSAVIFYALTIRFKNFSHNIYDNLLIIYTIDFFTCFIFGYMSNTKFFGRIRTIQILMTFSLIGFFLAIISDQNDEKLQNILIIISRICFNSIFCIIYFLSTEIYPTVIRAKGLGYNSAFSRIGGLLAPMLVEDISDLTKWKIFCVSNLLCIVFTFFLPETVGKPLLEKIPEEENENNTENRSD